MYHKKKRSAMQLLEVTRAESRNSDDECRLQTGLANGKGHQLWLDKKGISLSGYMILKGSA